MTTHNFQQYYFCYQWLVALCSLIAIGLSYDNYRRNQQLTERNLLSELTVVQTICPEYSGNRIVARFNSKEYVVSVSEHECERLVAGNKIHAIYNNSYGYFFLPDRLFEFKRHVWLSGIVLLFSMVPYIYWN